MPSRRRFHKHKGKKPHSGKKHSKPSSPSKKKSLKSNAGNVGNNQGHNVKRIVSQRMMSHQSINGKETGFVDIFSAVKKNNKSQILRHMNLTQNGKKRSSTVLAKHNGKKIRVLESSKNGKKVSSKKYSINNPEKLKEVFSVQSNSIKGQNVIKSMNLKRRNGSNNRSVKKIPSMRNVDNMGRNTMNNQNDNQNQKPSQSNPMVNLAQSLKEILKPVNSNPQKKKKNRKSRNRNKRHRRR